MSKSQTPPSSLPLAGITVLAVEQYGAAPFGSMLLADLGAEVIKIENPTDGGDMARDVGPYFLPDGSSQFFHAFNRNKRSLTLNLKSADGRALFHRLVEGADAVLNNLRDDLPAKLGLDYPTLGAVNPGIVCAHLSAYGRDGPRASWPGYDYLIQAEAGYLSVTGEPEGPPARFGLSVVDMMTGLMAAFALTSGVIGARATGKSMDLDTSLFDTGLQNLSYLAAWYLNAGHNQGREPRSAHPSLTPSQLYRTRDGWLFVMCNKEKFWPILCEALGRTDWAANPRFESFAGRREHRDEITAKLDSVLSERTTAEWLVRLQGIVPVAPVNDVAQALESPFVAEQGRTEAYSGPDGMALIRLLTAPIRVGGADAPRRAGPALGADTDDILRGLGAGEIAEFKDRSVV